MIGDIEHMKCSVCFKKRIKTDNSVCLMCKPAVVPGIETEKPWSRYKDGKEIKTKNKNENSWMSK